MCLNSLTQALKDDPDLASLPSNLVALNFQMLFTCSGCDYISFFSGYGKAEFLNTFCQHAIFITGNGSKGRLSDCSDLSKKQGYLSFLQLIGTMYFKKHYAAFVSLKGIETPQQLLNSIQSNSPSEKVKTWYNDIRAIGSERITKDEQRMPSESAIWRHWLRCCWITQMWRNSPQQDVFSGLASPDESGWLSHKDGDATTWSVDWDCPHLQTKIQATINFLTKGCACNKVRCEGMRCGCHKKWKCMWSRLSVLRLLAKKKQCAQNEEDNRCDEDNSSDTCDSGTVVNQETEKLEMK